MENADPHNGTVLEHREVAAQKLGRPLLPIEVVHHIDEDKMNNDPQNLIVFRTGADHSAHHAGGELVPHDDGTFSSTRIKRRSKRVRVLLTEEEKRCIECGKGRDRAKKGTLCWECHRSNSASKVKPDKDTLERLVWEKPTRQIAEDYGVSDVAVSKWCRQYGLSKPPRGYWQKLQAGKLT